MKNKDYKLKAILNTYFFRKMPLKQWRMLLIVGVFLWIWVVGLSSLHAATLCVNPGGINGCYALPSTAVAAATLGDTILIHSGTYIESGTITITKSLKIIGDNPLNTKVQNSVVDSVFLIPAGYSASAEIANLTITGGGDGIGIGAGLGAPTAIIHHNHIEFNGKSGIPPASGCCGYNLIAYNNVVRFNNTWGIYGSGTGANVQIYNNIVTRNGSTGIYGGTASYNSSYNNGSNGTSNYQSISGNIGNISSDCIFKDEASGDYRLQSGSPCKDAGNPGYLDADGTRSDMGSFGGPGAVLFWPYGNGGPVVTNLTVDPPFVPEGGTISIKATVEIR